jgi:hypothetical protein
MTMNETSRAKKGDYLHSWLFVALRIRAFYT